MYNGLCYITIDGIYTYMEKWINYSDKFGDKIVCVYIYIFIFLRHLYLSFFFPFTLSC